MGTGGSMSAAQHTPGPWRWEFNQKHKTLQLVGGRPTQYDLTIIQPTRWGMGSATLFIRDTAPDGFNLLHKLHERPDWIAPFPGRAHHANWCADVTHPDMRLIATAPELLEALQVVVKDWTAQFERRGHLAPAWCKQARAAIAKATGQEGGAL